MVKAVVRRILDSVDVLPWKARTLVHSEALKSVRSDVRHAALRQIAAMDWTLARTLGLRDPNSKVRRWASGLTDPATSTIPTNGPPASTLSTSKKSSGTRAHFSTDGQSSISGGAVGRCRTRG